MNNTETLENAVCEYVTTKFDVFMNLARDFDFEKSPRKRTDIEIEIRNQFDRMMADLKYIIREEYVSKEDEAKKEARQKMLKEFGFPERL